MACSGRNGMGTGSLDLYEKYTLPREREETIKRLIQDNDSLREEIKQLKKNRGKSPLA